MRRSSHGTRGGAPGRPVSWCTGGGQTPGGQGQTPPNHNNHRGGGGGHHSIGSSSMENRSSSSSSSSSSKHDDQTSRFESSTSSLNDGLPPVRVGLARSTSYQALHSALARLYRIDDFTMERIGQGFFSEVFKVRHRVTGDIMVLKMNKLISNRHNMLREVELMNRLHHPHILSYYGVCVNEGQVHALTEYINGGSLDTLIQDCQRELPWAVRVSLALDIAKGMDYLHSQRVFHRDLTSKNVLIKDTEECGRTNLSAVIADFGLAAPIPSERCLRLRQVGSPYWMAPEVIRGDWYDHRVDVFSFGIIVSEMIARCEADPDVLPRTNNFGVHYLAFSKMCKDDCPPMFLQMAFQCCQIDPGSRPSFQELTIKLEGLLNHLLNSQRHMGARRQKVSHRRSLSDDTFILQRNQLTENISGNSCAWQSNDGGSKAVCGTPKEVIEHMSANDPYFQPSSATVNPFTQLKLPARSQLVIQEGGRCCHSLPDANNLSIRPHTTTDSASHLAASDSSLCPSTSPTPPHHCQCGGVQSIHSADPNYRQCHCVTNDLVHNTVHEECVCKCLLSSHPMMTSAWQRDTCRTSGGHNEEDGGGSSSSPRSDGGSGGGGGSTLGSSHLGAIRRRGSGESGFFSVGDVERVGTPELCLSYSELSTASLVSTEDEEVGHQFLVQRSSSVITDSSEDLSSLGCCHDPQHCCELDPDDRSRLLDTDYNTDIRSIVEFFEQGYGSFRPMSDGQRRVSTNPITNKERVPQLRNKFSNPTFSQRSHSGFSLIHTKQPWVAPVTMVTKSYNTKDTFSVKSCRQPCNKVVKDRPKVFITEGTVRAKRDIFESK